MGLILSSLQKNPSSLFFLLVSFSPASGEHEHVYFHPTRLGSFSWHFRFFSRRRHFCCATRRHTRGATRLFHDCRRHPRGATRLFHDCRRHPRGATRLNDCRRHPRGATRFSVDCRRLFRLSLDGRWHTRLDSRRYAGGSWESWERDNTLLDGERLALPVPLRDGKCRRRSSLICRQKSPWRQKVKIPSLQGKMQEAFPSGFSRSCPKIPTQRGPSRMFEFPRCHTVAEQNKSFDIQGLRFREGLQC